MAVPVLDAVVAPLKGSLRQMTPVVSAIRDVISPDALKAGEPDL